MGIGRWRGAFRIDGERRGRRVGEQDRREHARWRGRPGEAGEQVIPGKAGVPCATFRIQDLELCATARWSVAVSSDGHRAPLPHNVPAQPDPARAPELQPQPARFLDGGGQATTEGIRLQDDEQRARPPGERREPGQPVTHPATRHRGIPAVRQVHHEQVNGPGGEQRRSQDEGLLELGGSEHDEPVEAHTPRNRLHRIEGPGEIQPRDDRPARLRLSSRTQRHGGLARGRISAQRHGGGARQPTRAEDGVQSGKPGLDDVAVHVRIGDAGPGPRRGGRWLGRAHHGGTRIR